MAIESPPRQHAHDAARFTALVESASDGDWARPTPVAEWAALDIVRHLIEWSRGFVGGAGIELASLDVDADPVAAWRQHVTDIQAVLDDPAGRVLRNPHTGERPVEEAIDQFYTADIWLHSWDLAKALGREPDLNDERCRIALTAMRPMERMLRESGQFGPAVPVADGVGAQQELMAFLGRDPAWSPDRARPR
jgi:uncharacterized protein (TIGR03086 family)